MKDTLKATHSTAVYQQLEPTTLEAGFPAAEAIGSESFLVSSQFLFTILFVVCIISGIHRYMKMALKTIQEDKKKLENILNEQE